MEIVINVNVDLGKITLLTFLVIYYALISNALLVFSLYAFSRPFRPFKDHLDLLKTF